MLPFPTSCSIIFHPFPFFRSMLEIRRGESPTFGPVCAGFQQHAAVIGATKVSRCELCEILFLEVLSTFTSTPAYPSTPYSRPCPRPTTLAIPTPTPAPTPRPYAHPRPPNAQHTIPMPISTSPPNNTRPYPRPCPRTVQPHPPTFTPNSPIPTPTHTLHPPVPSYTCAQGVDLLRGCVRRVCTIPIPHAEARGAGEAQTDLI